LLIAGELGQGKRSSYDEYRVQNRGGSGVIAIKTHGVAGALSVHEDDEIMMFTHGGQAVRSPVKDVRVIGRTTQGVRLINLAEGDKLIGICRIVDIKDSDTNASVDTSNDAPDGADAQIQE
jgi:DNA gyrase subunit A